MNIRHSCLAAFGLGLAALAWVGQGYLTTNPLALVMTLLIAAFYGLGGLELKRFHQATTALEQALNAVPSPLPSLGEWLATLPAGLQGAVRLRIEGERAALPGPALTPFLLGLLVLLGMLGTFLGMVVTLNGAVLALDSTTDVATMRGALVAPVKGLGLAFGTSVAGVAASAVLGLISALCRRERGRVSQLLDTRIAGELRVHSRAHQRDETFKTLQAQAQLVPAVVEQLQTLMAQLAQQHQQLSSQLQEGQARFHQGAEKAYGELATSVDRSLKHSLEEGARVAAATLQPVAEATMAGIAREASALHTQVASTVQSQLQATTQGLAERFGDTTQALAQRFGDTTEGLAERLGHTTEHLAAHIEQTTQGLAGQLHHATQDLAQRFGQTVQGLSEGWSGALASQAQQGEALHQGLQAALLGFNQAFDERATALLATVAQTHSGLQGQLQTQLSGLAEQTTALHQRLADGVQQQLDGVGQRFDAAVGQVSATWAQALAQHERSSTGLAGQLQGTLGGLAHSFDERASALLATVEQAHATLQAELAAKDAQRLAAWQQAMGDMAATLQQQWQHSGEQALAQQQQICQTLDRTASEITTQAEAHARATIAEIAQLMQSASEAPRVAAEVIAQLRQQLSTSLANDNAMLEERSRIMATLSTLLDAVQQASTEQRGAIDALLGSTAQVLEQVGSRFSAQVEAESGRLGSVAEQITASSADVAGMGAAFGEAVQGFAASNDKLMAQLERIEAALSQSLARSDEQLAYYVAQAREVIDLSLLSQKQIMEDLQRLAHERAGEAV